MSRRRRSRLPATTTEKSRRVPILYDVDVAVAGAGLCSSFAAIAAGRQKVETLVVDRHCCLGGNIGPGRITAGSLWGEAEETLRGGLVGIAAEFAAEIERKRVNPLKGLTGPQATARNNHLEDSLLASKVLQEMMESAGVEILAETYVGDPIVRKGTVTGFFVETKGGRQAVRAKVTVDGTGEADLARRAGAPMIPFLEADPSNDLLINPRKNSPQHPTYFNDTCILFAVGGVDRQAYERFCRKRVRLSQEEEKFHQCEARFRSLPRALIPAVKKAFETEGFDFRHRIGRGLVLRKQGLFRFVGDGLAYHRIGCEGSVDAADPVLLSWVNRRMRDDAFDLLTFYNRHVPGFEQAFMAVIGPLPGWRGGPCIKGEPGMRCRPAMMVFGECVGTAAALAAQTGVSPRKLDVERLQRRLARKLGD